MHPPDIQAEIKYQTLFAGRPRPDTSGVVGDLHELTELNCKLPFMIEFLNLPVNFTRTKSSSAPRFPARTRVASSKSIPFCGRRLLVDRLLHNIGLAGVGRCVTTVVGDWCGYGVIKFWMIVDFQTSPTENTPRHWQQPLTSVFIALTSISPHPPNT